MKVHFIAIGGSAMHNLAIALQDKGYHVTGSDDEIYEPSKSKLETAGLMPKSKGWHPELITPDLDAVILGMHAQNDNPELKKARELKLKMYSYPEYLFEQTKNKVRVVIGGSHGKTTITSMIIHVLKYHGKKFDYMVGAQIEGFNNMVHLSDDAPIAIFEGDEYLSSVLDPRPKFHVYKPNVALISGIAWDHINVFSTFDVYVEQFKMFIEKIEKNGHLVYNNEDPLVAGIALIARDDIKSISYQHHPYKVDKGIAYLLHENKKYPVKIFGKHNMSNINGAKQVCKILGLTDQQFYKGITTFEGAAKRLQLIGSNENTNIYLDFAHSPSKLTATVKAVKNHFPDRQLIACLELHTFSSLSENFLKQYHGTMEITDKAYVYYNPQSIESKKLKSLSSEFIAKAFDTKHLEVFTDSLELINELKSISLKNKNLLFMSSGNFDGIDFNKFASQILNQ